MAVANFPIYVRIYYGTTYCKIISEKESVNLFIKEDAGYNYEKVVHDVNTCIAFDHYMSDEAQIITEADFNTELKKMFSMISKDCKMKIIPVSIN